MRVAFNRSMAGFCASMLQEVGLPTELDGLIHEASFISEESCYFISDLFQSRGNARLSLFHDETGYECYVNHIHIDHSPEQSSLLQALRVLSLVQKKWLASQYSHLGLRHIISRDDVSCVYRCHVIRQGQSWLAEDLDGYSEPVLMAEYLPHGENEIGEGKGDIQD